MKQLQEMLHKNAKSKGWWNPRPNIPTILCLIHSEVSEALEAYRIKDDDNFKEELADVAIRLLDACEAWGINLEEEILKKHEINTHRSYRHGGKVC